MIAINAIIVLLSCLVCVIGFVSLALLIRAHTLYTRAVDILEVAAHGWLKRVSHKDEQEEETC